MSHLRHQGHFQYQGYPWHQENLRQCWGWLSVIWAHWIKKYNRLPITSHLGYYTFLVYHYNVQVRWNKLEHFFILDIYSTIILWSYCWFLAQVCVYVHDLNRMNSSQASLHYKYRHQRNWGWMHAGAVTKPDITKSLSAEIHKKQDRIPRSTPLILTKTLVHIARQT